MKFRLAIFLIFSILTGIKAQEMLVFGKVISADEKQPIPFANLKIKAANVGAASNDSGVFFLSLPKIQEQTLVASVVGYKKKEIPLPAKPETFLEILLEPEQVLLDEVVILPGANPALELLKRVREKRKQNDPDGFETATGTSISTTDVYLANLSRKSLQRKFLKELLAATVDAPDSTKILPLYRAQEKRILPDSVVDFQAKSFEAVGEEKFQALVENYAAAANFYKNNLQLFGRNFVSPLSAAGNVYYRFALKDSLFVGGRKSYAVQFSPKSRRELAFRGEMVIDSLSAALVEISATLPKSAGINYVSEMVFSQKFTLQNENFVYKNKNQAITFSLDFLKETKGAVAILNCQTAFEIEDFQPKPQENLPFSAAESEQKIDQLNNTKFTKFAAWTADVFLHGYFHAWKFDIGTIWDFYRYNKLEKHRLTLGLRTNETMMKNLTVGGFVGYGFGDKRWKFGGEIRGRFGEKISHEIGAKISDNVEQYGKRDLPAMLDFDFISHECNLITSVRFSYPPDVVRKKNLHFYYKFQQNSFFLQTKFSHEELFANHIFPLSQSGFNVDKIGNSAVSLLAYYGMKQRFIDGFFHRYFLENSLPIMIFSADFGHYFVKEKQGNYARMDFLLRQTLPLGGGQFQYMFEASHTAGKVPWTLLGSAKLWSSDNHFSLLKPMEFMADLHAYASATYFTKGYLFNWIPGVELLNLRELLALRLAWGGVLNPAHREILDFHPNTAGDLRKPYLEVGVGLANILRFFSLESVWRLTHRDANPLKNWGLQLRFDVFF